MQDKEIIQDELQTDYGIKENNEEFVIPTREVKEGLESRIDDPDYEFLKYDETEQVVKYINDLTESNKGYVLEEFKFDDERLKEFFLEESSFNNINKKDEKISLLDTLEELTKIGRHSDVYLPQSNLVARTYEFENSLVTATALSVLNEDFEFKSTVTDKSTINNKFVDKIIEYTDLIAKDTRKMTSNDLNNLSSKDVELLTLNAARLLSMGDEQDKDRNRPVIIRVDSTCSNCQQINELELNMDDLIRKTYTKEIIEYANKNFSLDSTIEENSNRSRFKKAKGIRYTNKKLSDNESSICIMIKLTEPSYLKMRTLEDKVFPHYLNKYEENGFFYDLTSNSNYSSATIRGKLNLMYRYIQQQLRFSQTNSSWSISVDFTQDLDKLYMLMYIDTIVLIKEFEDKSKKPEILENYNIFKLLTIENELEAYEKVLENIEKINKIISKLPKDLYNEINEKIKDFEKHSLNEFIQEFDCKNSTCKHHNSQSLKPLDLVFSHLQSL